MVRRESYALKAQSEYDQLCVRAYLNQNVNLIKTLYEYLEFSALVQFN